MTDSCLRNKALRVQQEPMIDEVEGKLLVLEKIMADEEVVGCKITWDWAMNFRLSTFDLHGS